MDLINLYNHFILEHANKKDLISLNNAATGDLDHLFDNKDTLHLVMSLWMKDDPQLNKNFERMLSQLPELKTDEIYIYDEEKNDGYSFKVFNADLLRDLIQIRVANAIRSNNFDDLIVDEKTLSKLEDLKKSIQSPKKMIYKSLMSHDNGYTHTHSAYITADNEEDAEKKASLIAEKLHLVCQEPVFLAEKQELHCPIEVYQEPILIYATDTIENKTAMNISATDNARNKRHIR